MAMDITVSFLCFEFSTHRLIAFLPLFLEQNFYPKMCFFFSTSMYEVHCRSTRENFFHKLNQMENFFDRGKPSNGIFLHSKQNQIIISALFSFSIIFSLKRFKNINSNVSTYMKLQCNIQFLTHHHSPTQPHSYRV